MKYRDFLTLTDEEIEFIIKDIFDAEKVENIERDEKWREITCDMTTGGWSDDESENFSITDTITLKEPALDDCGLSINFSINDEEKVKWRQFCLAKGCNEYLKDNPYLEIANLPEVYDKVAKDMKINFRTGFLVDTFETDTCVCADTFYECSDEEVEECIMDWIHSYKDNFIYNVISRVYPEIKISDELEKHYEKFCDGCFDYLVKRAFGKRYSYWK